MKKLYLGICRDVQVNGVWAQTYTTEVGVYATKSGPVWRGLKARRTSNMKAYGNCSNKFKDFQEFCSWHRQQQGYDSGWQLDKDLLGDSVIYSSSTCCLLPRELNSLLQGIGCWKRGQVVGASYVARDNSWRAYGNVGYRQVHLGCYSTQYAAHRAWRKHKALVIQGYDSTQLSGVLQNALQKLVLDLNYELPLLPSHETLQPPQQHKGNA